MDAMMKLTKRSQKEWKLHCYWCKMLYLEDYVECKAISTHFYFCFLRTVSIMSVFSGVINFLFVGFEICSALVIRLDHSKFVCKDHLFRQETPLIWFEAIVEIRKVVWGLSDWNFGRLVGKCKQGRTSDMRSSSSTIGTLRSRTGPLLSVHVHLF